jgi:hypothetical protein
LGVRQIPEGRYRLSGRILNPPADDAKLMMPTNELLRGCFTSALGRETSRNRPATDVSACFSESRERRRLRRFRKTRRRGGDSEFAFVDPLEEEMMATVYIEARPKGRPEGSPIESFVVEDHADHVLETFTTQHEAIEWAKKNGHSPHVARVRHLNDKKIADHWRAV